MSIFSNIWSTMKSIPSQYKALGQIGKQIYQENIGSGQAVGNVKPQTFKVPTTQPAPKTGYTIGAATDIPYNPEFAHDPYSGQYYSQQGGGTLTPQQVSQSVYYQPATTTPQAVQPQQPSQPSQTSQTSQQPQQSFPQPTQTYTPYRPAAQPQQQTWQQTFSSGSGHLDPTTGDRYLPATGGGYRRIHADGSEELVPHIPGQEPVAPPAQPTSGTATGYQPIAPPDASGMSAKTGLLGGVSAGVPPIGGVSIADEEEQTITIPQGATLGGIAQQQGLSLQDLLTANPQITDPNYIRAGEQLIIPRPKAQPQGLRLPSIITPEGAIDLSASQAGINQIKDLLKSPLTKQTQSQVMEYLEQSKSVLLQTLQQLEPLPQEPILKPEEIAEDQNQLDQLQGFEQQQYEDLQRDLGIPQTITDYENAIKELQATDQAFDAIVREVNEDPDFPKGLARRRIQAIEKERGVRANALRNKINLLQTSLQLKKTEFADRMGITRRAIQRQQAQQEDQRKDARNQLKMLMDTGAISKMSDTELYQLAQMSGYTFESLKKIKEAITSGNKAKVAKAEADLERQQKTLELSQQREARLAGGGTGGDTGTTTDTDKIIVNPDGSIDVGGISIPSTTEQPTDKKWWEFWK